MGRKKKTIHYLYKTTCNITGRYYYGMHSTINLDDGYLGSGTILRRSVRKYGKDNHTKEIVKFYDSRDLLSKAEKEIITEEFIQDVLCMNLTEGGSGTFVHINKKLMNNKVNQCYLGGKAFSLRLETDQIFRDEHRIRVSNNMSDNHKLGKIKPVDWTGKKHSDETKLKMSESKKGKGLGNTNSQYGKCWITNEVENKKIDKDSPIPEGWRKGRII